MFALFDTEDELWMGTDMGPLVYADEMVARVAAAICDRSLHQHVGRTRARKLDAPFVRLRDQKPLLTPAVEALAQLEEGRF